MSFYIGVDGVSREVKDMYIGIDGKARRVKTALIGVSNKARTFYGGYYMPDNDETIVSLGIKEHYDTGIAFAPGTYEVSIAGTPDMSSANCFVKTVTMKEPFKIVALCGDVDYARELGVVTSTPTIFGGKGGLSAGVTASGISQNEIALGALTSGSCACHFMPLDGVFGTDYFRCFHCGRDGYAYYGGCGAYGGGAGGRGGRVYVSATRKYADRTGSKGVDGIGGVGGAGGTGTINNVNETGANGKPGSPGSGIGAGTATHGGVAYYDGSTWSEPTRGKNTEGHAYIIIKYLGK